jgi:hypothetical protein
MFIWFMLTVLYCKEVNATGVLEFNRLQSMLLLLLLCGKSDNHTNFPHAEKSIQSPLMYTQTTQLQLRF